MRLPGFETGRKRDRFRLSQRDRAQGDRAAVCEAGGATGQRQISECKALTAASRLSTATNRFTECGDKTYLSATIP
jgi:hypothetical protein